MVPVPDRQISVYFPPLDKLLVDGRLLISWKNAYAAICDPYTAKSSPGLEKFLKDDGVIALLRNECEPFGEPTAQSKNDYENRTSSINIPPTPNGSYDLSQIKDDTLWLSKEAKIDEVQALRIAVLEWQSQPAARILSGYTEEEDISLQRAVQTADFSSSLVDQQISNRPAAPQEDDAASAQAARRRRLLTILSSERLSALRIAYLASAASMPEPIEPEGRSYGPSIKGRNSEAPLGWLVSVGQKIAIPNNLGGYIDRAITSLEARFPRINNGCDWTMSSDQVPEPAQEYSQSSVEELICILELIFIRVSSNEGSLPPKSIASWFSFMHNYGFFERFQLPYPGGELAVTKIQALVSFISLQTLKLPYTLESLEPSARSNLDNLGILDVQVLDKVHEALWTAASNGSNIAGPAALAWAVIMDSIKGIKTVASLRRDSSVPLEEDALSLDSNSSPSLRRASLAIPSEIKGALTKIEELAGGENVSKSLAQLALEHCGLIFVVSQLSTLSSRLFGSTSSLLPCLHARIGLLELHRQIYLITSYCEPVFETNLAILRGTSDTGIADLSDAQIVINRKVSQVFVNDDNVLAIGLLQQSQTRYPMEILPFLTLSRALTSLSYDDADGSRLQPFSEPTATFTQILPPGFAGYEVVRDEEDEANCLRLTEDLPLFASRRKGGMSFGMSSADQQALTVSHYNDAELAIPRGTIGYVVNDARPLVVMWRHPHSTLKYLGLLLATVPSNSSKVSLLHESPLDQDLQIEIVTLLSALLSPLVGSGNRINANQIAQAKTILAEASDGLERNEDIITVVADIFESELAQPPEAENSASELLSSCLAFFTAVVNILPNRIWPILARSRVLGLDCNGSKMLAIIVSNENPISQKTVLHQVTNLFNALVTDAVTNVIKRKSPSTTSASRYDASDAMGAGTSQKMMSKVMLAFSQQAMFILQWFSTLSPEIRLMNISTVSQLLRVFKEVTRVVFSYDDVSKPDDKLMAVLVPTAEFIMTSISHTASATLVTSFHAITGSEGNCPSLLSDSEVERNRHEYTLSVILLFTKVLEINMLRDTHFALLDERLSLILPLVIRLYAADITLRKPILKLLRAMVQRSRSAKSGSASLGHLSSRTGKNFMSLLHELCGSLGDTELERETWDFLAAIAASEQQSLVTFIATGETPKNSLKHKQDDRSRARSSPPFLAVALDWLSREQFLATPQAISGLRFVSLMQCAWPGVTLEIRRNQDFHSKLADYMGTTNLDVTKRGFEKVHYINAAHIIADILSVFLHGMRQLNDMTIIKILVPKLSYLATQGVAIPAYNNSLHPNLKRNFEKRFSGCALTSFKHASTGSDLGDNYYYDLDYAREVLSFDSSWDKSKTGFAEEFRRANENLSLVEAQIMLMASWKCLAIELSMCIGDNKPLEQILTSTVEQCLSANSQSFGATEDIFESLLESRAELAQMLLQRLTSVRSQNPTMLSLLSTTWDAIKATGQDFETLFVGDNTPYLRLLLGILILALQPHTYTSSASLHNSRSGNRRRHDSVVADVEQQALLPADEISALLVTIVTEVIGKGFRSLAAQIHEDVSSVAPSDFGLVISTLQSVLHVTDASAIHAQLTLRLMESNVHRYALSLFSWSDRLLASDTDPVIGDLSISFIRELSQIPQMAEFLATEGILSQLDTAPLLNHIRERKAGYGPSDHPPRLHSIWARGVLPLILNVLVAVGESYAAEVITFLNGFPDQMDRAARAFGAKGLGAVSLDVAAEVHTLSLIALALDRYRGSLTAVAVAGGYIPELAWDHGGLREDLEGWVNGTGAGVQGRVVPGSEREARLARTKPEMAEGSSLGSRLEEMVVEELKGAMFCLGFFGGAGEKERDG